MDKNKLIDMVSAQIDGLLRGNMEAIISDCDTLRSETGQQADIPVTINLTLAKDRVYIFYSKIKWNKTNKHEDEAESESYDPDQGELFEDDKTPINKPKKLKLQKVGEFLESGMAEGAK